MMFAKLSGSKDKKVEKNKVSGRKLPAKIVKKDTKKPISRKATKNTKKKKSKKTVEDSIIELANKD